MYTVPSTTFFHLPQAKREKLLQCARDEFSRVPFDEASINRIVHQAEISRGSFYMYFTDKADLFRYLLQCYLDDLTQLMVQLLDREQGDLFAAFESLFQALVERREDLAAQQFQAIAMPVSSREHCCARQAPTHCLPPCLTTSMPPGCPSAKRRTWRTCSIFSSA